MKTITLIIFMFFLSSCTVGKPEFGLNNGRLSVVCPLSQLSFKDMEVSAKKHGLQWYKFNAKSMQKIVSYYNGLPDKPKINPDFIGIFVPNTGSRGYLVIVKDTCIVDSGTISMKALNILLTSVPI